MVSRHSIFYSPLIITIAGGYLERRGVAAQYAILGKGQKSQVLIRDGIVDIMQSAVSSNWRAMEHGEAPLPVHFAQINQRDGFFLVGRVPDDSFTWPKLVGQQVLADHGWQPLVMLKSAVRRNSVDWTRVKAIDAGTPEQMVEAFRGGHGTYVHLQSPAAHQLEFDGEGYVVAAVGTFLGPVAFSSLCCSREFTATETFRRFVQAYREAREWVRKARALEVAQAEAAYFERNSLGALEAGIRAYQEMGAWEGGIEIAPPLYKRTCNIFQKEAAITQRPPYEEVCMAAL